MSLILPTPAQPSDTRHPRIGYHCLADGATVTADSTATGYAAVNVFDWKPYTYWKPAATGAHHIQIVLAEPAAADYFAIAQHNIGDNGGTVRLQYSIDAGGTWHDATAAFAPVAREPLWFDFAEITADHWRIVVDAPVASVLAVAAFGLSYMPYRGKFQGFQIPGLARSFSLYTGTSESGLFLGRSILRREIKGSIAFDLMEVEDGYSQWKPFMQAAEAHPFFLAWMLSDWPDDVQLVQTDGDWTPPAMSSFGFLTTSLRYRGLLPE